MWEVCSAEATYEHVIQPEGQDCEAIAELANSVHVSNITTLLTALTAYKVGRYDLIRAASAFRRLEV